jgi:hypothetical protein
MTTFEEQFPSLKGMDAFPLKWRRVIPSDNFRVWARAEDAEVYDCVIIEEKVYPETSISLRCLDKQRVRKLVNELEERFSMSEPECEDMIDILREELGL